MKRFFGAFKGGVGWAKGLHREAALDSVRNVLAVVGGATILADFTTIKAWLVVPMLVVAFVVWFLDYERHFVGKTADETKMPDPASIPASPSRGTQ